jgi:hypothetical protein
VVTTSKGQNHSYGLSVGVGNGAILKQKLAGAPSYEMSTGFSVGLQYNKKLTNTLQLMTGINWYDNSVAVTPNFYPGRNMTPKDYSVQLIYIPLLLKVDLSKYFFVNGGLLGDIDITNSEYITSQSGLGASFGIGTEFSITDNFSIQLNPYLNFHGLLLADKQNYPERIFDPGIKLNFVLHK